MTELEVLKERVELLTQAVLLLLEGRDDAGAKNAFQQSLSDPAEPPPVESMKPRVVIKRVGD